MASTRNINTRGDYNLEQRDFRLNRQYMEYVNAATARAYNEAIPALGFNPSRISRETLCNNPIDVESMLFGINSTNLVTPQKPIKPELKQIPTLKYFNCLPVYMPKPLVIENNQRPYPI